LPAQPALRLAYRLIEHDDARKVKALVEKEGRKAILIAGDIGSPEHCRSIIKHAVGELGGIDNLSIMQPIRRRSRTLARLEQGMAKTFEVNIQSMFFLTKAAVPHMKPGSDNYQHYIDQSMRTHRTLSFSPMPTN
jgi:hypothetical protein